MSLEIDGEVIDLKAANFFLVTDSEGDFVDDLSEENTHGVFSIIVADSESLAGSYSYRMTFTGYYPLADGVDGEYRLMRYGEYSLGVPYFDADEFAMKMEVLINRGDEDDWYGWDEMEVDGSMEVTSDGDKMRMVSSGSFERWRTIDDSFGDAADELEIRYTLTAEGELITSEF